MNASLLVRLCGLWLIAVVVALTWVYWRPPSTPAVSPHWTVRTVESGGHQAILARLDSLRGRNWAGKPYQLVLRCQDHKTLDAYVDWATLIGTGSPPMIRWQVEQSAAVNERWLTSLSGATTFVHDPGTFVKALHSHQELIVKLRDQQGKTHQAIFALTDAGRVLAPLRKDCGQVRPE